MLSQELESLLLGPAVSHASRTLLRGRKGVLAWGRLWWRVGSEV